ncbi:hypothetical protein B0H14DRAFT_2565611 [Mycena olivaceomarginata]|nr:hypothetical protein B0H14DRAFT_2565611 [Mycena olivaceomarginata]
MPEDVWVRAPDKQENDLGEWLRTAASSSTARIAAVAAGGEVRRSQQRISGGGLGEGARTAYLLGHLQTRTNTITDAARFCVHGWFDFSDRGKDVWNEHTVVGGKGLSSRQGGGKVGNACIVVGRDLSASV